MFNTYAAQRCLKTVGDKAHLQICKVKLDGAFLTTFGRSAVSFNTMPSDSRQTIAQTLRAD